MLVGGPVGHALGLAWVSFWRFGGDAGAYIGSPYGWLYVGGDVVPGTGVFVGLCGGTGTVSWVL